MPEFRSLLGRRRRLSDVTPEETASSQQNPGLAPKLQKVFHTGLKPLYEPEAAIADVIFVHGLTGDSEETWKSKNAVLPWPQTLLPAKIPQVRVLTFGYDANVADWRGMVSKNRIGDHAKNLLSSLATYREEDDTDHRPIFFVAHSLGGLVCEDALLASKNSADEHLQNILPCTKGILFLGTPHAGAGLAHWAEMMAKSMGFIKQTNSQIVEVLKSDSEVLARIQTEFHTMLRARAKNGDQPIEITCFYEELPLPGIGIVVPIHSANLPAYVPIGIHKNHTDMARFEVEDDPGFISVAGELRRWIRLLAQSSAVTDSKPMDAKRSSSKTLFMVPFDQDFHFIARDDIMSRIYEKFQNSRRVALAGTGGVGKSQIAIEYCYKFKKSNPNSNVFWIYCATIERFKQAYQEIARKLSLPGWDDPKTDVMKIVSEWLSDENQATWLMILDNADDNEKFFSGSQSLPEGEQFVPLLSYFPRTSNGFILVTTRDNRVGRRLTDSHPISVLPFDLQEARQLLKSKLIGSKFDSEILIDEDIECLLRELEYLPLAISQAAAFISENRISVAKYVRMLQDDNSELAALLDRDIPDLRRDSQASNSVLQTWKISFDQIQRQQPRAAEMLSLMAHFDRQSIPEFLLRRDGESESDFVTACGILQAFSLISVASEAGNFSLHRLVQLFTISCLQIREERNSFQEQALQILSTEYPLGNYENWQTCTLLAPHAQVILSYHPKISESSLLHRASLLYHLAWFECMQGRYQNAFQVCEESYDIRRDLRGESNDQTLHSLGLLARILNYQGRYDEAESIHRRVLMYREKLLGKEHSDTILSVSDLAQTLKSRGKYDEAEIMYRETLLLRGKVHGNEHSYTLTSMHNLANLLEKMGRYNEAETMQRQVLKISEQVLGREHPDTLASMHNLARLLRISGRYDEAEKMHRQELRVSGKVLGKEHPDTISRMNNLALVLHDQGQYDEAETMNRRILKSYENLLGKEHSYTLTSLNNLASGLYHQGKYDEVETMYRQALETTERVQGKEHPDTLTSMHNLATSLKEQGKLEEAEELIRKTVEISEKVLGVDHSDTLGNVWVLGKIVYLRDRCEEGFNFCQSAHLGLLKALGDKHPDNLRHMKWLCYMREEIDRIGNDKME